MKGNKYMPLGGKLKRRNRKPSAQMTYYATQHAILELKKNNPGFCAMKERNCEGCRIFTFAINAAVDSQFKTTPKIPGEG